MQFYSVLDMAARIDTTCWHLYYMSISIKQDLSGTYKIVEDPTLRLRDPSDFDHAMQ